MIIRHLHVKNLKLLRDFELSFVDDQDKPRMWTVIIGENGTAKTSLLQAIAMAAAGSLEVNSLAKKVTGQLRDRRQDEAMEIVATFGFLDPPTGAIRILPAFDTYFRGPDSTLKLISTVKLPKDSSSLHARSEFATPHGPLQQLDSGLDPLAEARDKNYAHWFVAGYGISRVLPDTGQMPDLQQPSIERLRPLFPETGVGLTSTAFAGYFYKQAEEQYTEVLNSVLFHTKRLLPLVSGLKLGPPGHVRKAGDLAEQNQIWQQVGQSKLPIPITALSHGYQSTIAWIADLVGHIVLEADDAVSHRDMQGLVLIDEIDLYLHPTWQVALIAALRETFPQIQFVATTHSPLVLAGLHPTEIVRLRFGDNGDIERAPLGADARVMTGTEIYREYFGIDNIVPDETGQKLQSYRYLAANPYRSDRDDQEIARLRDTLEQAGIDPAFEPVPRTK